MTLEYFLRYPALGSQEALGTLTVDLEVPRLQALEEGAEQEHGVPTCMRFWVPALGQQRQKLEEPQLPKLYRSCAEPTHPNNLHASVPEKKTTQEVTLKPQP